MMDQDTALEGIQYVVHSAGKPTAVIISLEEWGEIRKIFMM